MQERYVPSQDAIDTRCSIEQRFRWSLPSRECAVFDLRERLFDEEAATREGRAAADDLVVRLVGNDEIARPPLSSTQLHVIFTAHREHQAARQAPSASMLEAWAATQRRICWIREANRALDSRSLVVALDQYRQLAHAIEDALGDHRPLPF